MHPGLRKKLIYAAVIILVGVGFFYFYSSRSSTDDALVETDLAQASVGSVEVMRLLAELHRVSFPRDVLTSPILASLSDWSVILSPETPGRSNPFAPIGVGVAPQTADEPDSSE